MVIGRRRVVATAVLWLAPFAEGVAQRVAGVVSQAQGAPLSGAVVSLLDSGGRSLARTITDTSGRYGLAWQPSGTRLRVVRIGFRPAADRALSGAPRDTVIDVALEPLPTMLSTVQVSSDAVCSDSPDRRAALALWEQARAGLLAAVVTREAKPARMSNLTFERRLDPRTRQTRAVRTRYGSGSTSRPFLAARPAEAFARSGYMERQGSEEVFFAPDADVLLDDSFARVHCFGVQAGDDTHRGLIGLSFEPRTQSGRGAAVDVRGILWLDPVRQAITMLEFAFTGVHPVAARAGAGGMLRFQTVENGFSFVSEWTMLLPSVKPGQTPRAPPVASGLGETGGMVLDAEWPDHTMWRTRLAPVRGNVSERSTGAPMAGVVATIEGLPDTVDTDSSGFFAFDPLPPGRYVVQVADTNLRYFVQPRTARREVLVSDSTGSAAFELAPRAAVIANVCEDQPAGADSGTIVGRVVPDSGGTLANLQVESWWPTTVGLDKGQLADADESGHFRVCGVTPGARVRMQVRLGGVAIADSELELQVGRALHRVHWRLRAEAILAARRGDGGTFSGSVINTTTGAPVVASEVWLPLLDLHTTTDSAGRFLIYNLPAGRHFVQLRRLGYQPLRDTISILAGAGVTREYRLTSQAVELDTVHTVAAGTTYLSPALRGFEERRRIGAGKFLDEALLRKNDNRALADVLKRIPGVYVRQGPSGRAYVATNRTGGMGSSADPGIRGSPRGCWAAVYLDGVPVYGGPPQAAPDVAHMMTQEFAAVEFYAGSSTIPAPFNSTKASDCGLLLLWTRER